jgi:hypothetical protein
MATARNAASSTGTPAGGLARVCDLTAHPVPTFVARASDGRALVVERLLNSSRPRLSRDAGALMRLQHPNLARVRMVLPTPDGVDLVTDYIKGETLAELERATAQREEQLPLEVTLRILVDLLNGLFALHGHRDDARQPLGLFHGYVTPAHVVVGLDGTTHLVHLLLPPGLRASTQTAREPGAEDVAPELLAGKGEPRSDLYSVGALLHRAVSAAGDSDKSWALPFAEVARRAMQTDASARFATAAEMAAEIRKIAKAKLATPMIVAAAVDDIAGERIENRINRMPKPEAAPAPAVRASPGSFPEEAPTVPKPPAPHLLRHGAPALPPRAAASPKAPTITKPSLPLPLPEPAPVPELAPPPLPPPPPLASIPAKPKDAVPAAAAVPSAPIVTAPALPVAPAALVVPIVPLAPVLVGEPRVVPPSEVSEPAVELDVAPDPPPVDFVLLPIAPVEAHPSQPRASYERRRGVVLGVLGVATIILLVAFVRTLAQQHGQSDPSPRIAASSDYSAEAVASSSGAVASDPTPPPPVAMSPPAPHVDAPPVPVDTGPSLPRPPAPPPRKAALPVQTADTSPPPVRPRPAKPAPSTTKPSGTYDPLGI